LLEVVSRDFEVCVFDLIHTVIDWSR
jgi:Flp pilus assembly CpaE family ATPase